MNTNAPYFPRANAEITIGKFCAGQFVTVTRCFGVEADLEKMTDTDEVWIMCFRQPRPGGRLMGRFVAKDVFVGTQIGLREDIALATYSEYAEKVIDTWAKLAEGIAPIRSPNLDDYIGHIYRDLDSMDD